LRSEIVIADRRTLLLLGLVLGALRAETVAAPPAEEVHMTRIGLHPMPETRPALKYQLLPPLLDRRPGNAAVWWNRILADQALFFAKVSKAGGLEEKLNQWLAFPLGDPREQQFRQREPEIAQLGQNVLFSDMDYAARFDGCDWQLPLREGRLINMRFPELPPLRQCVRLLRAKARLEIGAGEYDRAVRTFQTGFALARHTVEGPTLVHALTASALVGLLSEEVEEFLQQPAAPNLYWALAALPRPLVDFGPGYETEMSFLYLNFPELKDLEQKNYTAERWREVLARFVDDLLNMAGSGEHQSSALVLALAVQGYPGAKRYLIEHGRPADEVERLPVAQVVLLYTVAVYRELNDDLGKYLFLPRAEAEPGVAQAEARFRARIASRQEIIPLASLLLPAVGSTKNAETRWQARLARLRILEALRIYAASHDGRLPDRLGDIREVPVPVNPCNDQPFDYHRDGARAILSGVTGPGDRRWRYEITMSATGEKR
jgi:hypothetical protein